jgi:hypothetical protein
METNWNGKNIPIFCSIEGKTPILLFIRGTEIAAIPDKGNLLIFG